MMVNFKDLAKLNIDFSIYNIIYLKTHLEENVISHQLYCVVAKKKNLSQKNINKSFFIYKIK